MPPRTCSLFSFNCTVKASGSYLILILSWPASGGPVSEAPAEEEALWEALGRKALWVALVEVGVGEGEMAWTISKFPGGSGMRFPGGAGTSPALAVLRDVAPEFCDFRTAFSGSGTPKRGLAPSQAFCPLPSTSPRRCPLPRCSRHGVGSGACAPTSAGTNTGKPIQ